MNDSKDHKAAAEPPLDCRVRRDIVDRLRQDADINTEYTLTGDDVLEAADEIERLRAELYVWRQMGRSLHDAGLRVVDVVPNA